MTNPADSLAAALAEFQRDLPELKKTNLAEVETKDPSKAYSYTYADLATASKTILPRLGAVGLSFTCGLDADDNGKMAMRWELLHSSGEKRTGRFPFSFEGGPRGLGGVITYYRRYLLLMVTGVAAEDDDDAAAAQAEFEGKSRTAQRQEQAASRAANRPTAARRSERAEGASGPPPLPGEPTDVMRPDQRNHIFALLHELGVGNDMRGAIVNRILTEAGQPNVSSFTELTVATADCVLLGLQHERDARTSGSEEPA
jgi:ERF superfamily